MVGILSSFIMPLICLLLGVIIGWVYRAQKKPLCKEHSDCKSACYQGRCESCQQLPPEARLIIGNVCPIAEDDITGRAVQAAATATGAAQQAQAQPPTPAPSQSQSTNLPPGWSQADFNVAYKLNDPTKWEQADYLAYDPVVKSRTST